MSCCKPAVTSCHRRVVTTAWPTYPALCFLGGRRGAPLPLAIKQRTGPPASCGTAVSQHLGARQQRLKNIPCRRVVTPLVRHVLLFGCSSPPCVSLRYSCVNSRLNRHLNLHLRDGTGRCGCRWRTSADLRAYPLRTCPRFCTALHLAVGDSLLRVTLASLFAVIDITYSKTTCHHGCIACKQAYYLISRLAASSMRHVG
jgi:hypothetical protein